MSGNKGFFPLFIPKDRFHDLTNYTSKMLGLRFHSKKLGSGLPVFNYPPFAAIVYILLLRSLPIDPVNLLLVPVGVFVVILAAWAGYRMRRAGPVGVVTPLALVFCTSPILFAADRGNIELILFIFTAAFCLAFSAEQYLAAALFLSVAIAIKPFPGMLLVLFLSRRLYREAALAAFGAALLTVFALVWLGPNPVRAYVDLRPGQKLYVDSYVKVPLDPNETRFLHSAMDAARIALLADKMHDVTLPVVGPLRTRALEAGGWQPYVKLWRMYPYAVGLASLLIVARVWKLPFLNQLLAVSIAITVLPPLSAEYTLLHLYVPAGLLLYWIACDRRSLAHHGIGITTMVLLLACALTPLTFFGLYAGVAKLCVLLVLLSLVLVFPLQDQPSAAGSNQVARIS